jgi:phosphohistidine swiveling domain-containing protein
MKALRKLLVLDSDGRSLGPLFKALFQKAVDSDPVLSLVGVTIENAGIAFANDVVEGKPVRQLVINAMVALGLSYTAGESKDIKNYPELAGSSDLIIVPKLAEEDAVCLWSDNAWSKTVTLNDSMTLAKTSIFHLSQPATVQDYVAWAHWAEPMLRTLVHTLKSSYSYAVIAKGICREKGTAIGEAHVARHGNDLAGFRRGRILVIDRAGTLMFHDLDPQIAKSIVKEVDPNNALGDTRMTPNGLEVMRVVVKHSSAVVCSRDDKYINTFLLHGIPRLAYCISSTDCIITGQPIVVDAEEGTVYDASLLRKHS